MKAVWAHMCWSSLMVSVHTTCIWQEITVFHLFFQLLQSHTHVPPQWERTKTMSKGFKQFHSSLPCEKAESTKYVLCLSCETQVWTLHLRSGCILYKSQNNNLSHQDIYVSGIQMWHLHKYINYVLFTVKDLKEVCGCVQMWRTLNTSLNCPERLTPVLIAQKGLY